MQNYCKTIGALAAASALVAGTASAEVEYEIHAGYSSEYIFRGVNTGDDLIETGLDAATEWNGIGLSAGAWFATFEAFNDDFQELDLYAEASKDLGFATAAIGYINYQNMNSSFSVQDAQEVYFSLAQSYFGIDFAYTYFWDVETDNDGYSTLSASKGFELSPCLTLNTGAALAYLWEQGDFAHLTAKVSLDWAFTETATLSPFIAHSWSLSEDGLYSGSENEFYGGTMLSVSF